MNGKRVISPASLVVAAGAGALLMYLLDPQQGRRRIALARDQAVHLARKGSDLSDASVRDLAHRTTGLLASLRGAMRRGSTDDEVLVERIRAKLGRWVSHPHAIHVAAAQGRVTLSGPVLRSQLDGVLQAVCGVRGVRDVDNGLEVHHSAENVPGLQGQRGRPGPRSEFVQDNWAPGPRLASIAAGSALAWYGFGRRSLSGALIGIVGVGLAVRAGTNKDLRRTLGLPRAARAQTIRKTITIAAPRETVFDQWSNYDNFPRFMSHVEEVKRIDDTRSHWVVKGPAGSRVEWDAAMTEHVRPERIAWRSEPDAPVRHAGSVHFDEADGGTRVSVEMSYTPPGGAVGHTLAKLLGRDPKQEMDADLMRMKSFIETGVAARDAAAAEVNRDAAATTPAPAWP